MANIKNEILKRVKIIQSMLLKLVDAKGKKKNNNPTEEEIVLVQKLRVVIDAHNLSGEKYLIQPPAISWSPDKVLAESEKLKAQYKL